MFLHNPDDSIHAYNYGEISVWVGVYDCFVMICNKRTTYSCPSNGDNDLIWISNQTFVCGCCLIVRHTRRGDKSYQPYHSVSYHRFKCTFNDERFILGNTVIALRSLEYKILLVDSKSGNVNLAFKIFIFYVIKRPVIIWNIFIIKWHYIHL